MLGLIYLLAIGFVVALCSAIAYVMYALTHPPRRTYASALARGRPGDPSELPTPRSYETWELSSGGLELPVWEIEGDDPSGPVAVMTSGWGDSRIGALVRLEALAPACSKVIAWEMPGHGEAPGSCSLGTREPGHLIALLDRLNEPRVVLYGWSLGGGVSLVAASEREVEGVICEAPYSLAPTPARNVMRYHHLPYRLNLPPAFWLLGTKFGVGPSWRNFDRAQWASKVSAPVLVIHGDMDEICPIEDGRAIADSAPNGELFVVEGGHHNDLWTDEAFREQCTDAVRGFIRKNAEIAE